MTIFSSLSYLKKQRFAPRQILSSPSKNLEMVVVIPCFDEPNLIRTLDSLEACQQPLKAVEVIIVVNSSENAESKSIDQNEKTIQEFNQWNRKKQSTYSYHLLHFPTLPKKHAGVGLARKIGMDEAVDRLEQVDNPQGVIICLDADSMVEENYLIEIEKLFRMNLNMEACSIFYEHPLSGNEFSTEIYEGIICYELFLRYYIQGLRFAGYPYAYHCVGSSMAVRSMAYQKRGGMNRRKAGEDFYFLQKFIPEETVKELFTTKVIPSPRPSEKVPFGTGRAILGWLENDQKIYPAYDPQTFADLKEFIDQVPSFFKSDPKIDFPDSIQAFLSTEPFLEKLSEIRKNVTSHKAFIKRFYGWFDGLKVLKYVHYARDHFYENVDVAISAGRIYEWVHQQKLKNDAKELLDAYREWEKGSQK